MRTLSGARYLARHRATKVSVAKKRRQRSRRPVDGGLCFPETWLVNVDALTDQCSDRTLVVMQKGKALE
uniref:Transposase n=1 Tax=Steinernema glaseri TaxID=37863 RepID=A0A1I7ZSJ6_9BILA